MKRIFMVLFLIGSIYSSYANNVQKNIIIRHIGDQDRMISTIVINLSREGHEFNFVQFEDLEYYIIQESTFNEIINFVNNNPYLFGSRDDWMNRIRERLDSSFGTFELQIENEGQEYYYYLIDRRSSALFYSKLYNLLIEKQENNKLIIKLELNFDYFHFNMYIPEIGDIR
jgi:hypothetical protein